MEILAELKAVITAELKRQGKAGVVNIDALVDALEDPVFEYVNFAVDVAAQSARG